MKRSERPVKRSRLSFIFEYLNHLSPPQIGVGSLVALPVIGLMDYFITLNLGMSIFYVFPILTLTWYLQPRFGYLASIASAVVWAIAEAHRISDDANALFLLWNTVVRLSFFTLVVFLLTEMKLAYQRERHLAQTDFLTGLFNRRAFTEILDREIQRSQRYGFAFTLAYLDVDNFKQVNDTLGHAAGDQLLQAIARILQNQNRAADYTARLGGDEFAMLLTQTDRDQATAALSRLFKELSVLEISSAKVGFSIGATTFSADLPNSADAALSITDQVMYTAKAQGKHQFIHQEYKAT